MEYGSALITSNELREPEKKYTFEGGLEMRMSDSCIKSALRSDLFGAQCKMLVIVPASTRLP